MNAGRALEVGVLGAERGQVGVRRDPEAEHVPVARSREDAVQLDAREHEQAVGRRRLGPLPVVGDREHVEARARVVGRERLGLELAVRAGRVRVQRAAQPLALDREGVGAIRRHAREDTTTALVTANRPVIGCCRSHFDREAQHGSALGRRRDPGPRTSGGRPRRDGRRRSLASSPRRRMSRSAMLRRIAAAASGSRSSRRRRPRSHASGAAAPPLRGGSVAVRHDPQGGEEGRQHQHDRASAGLGELRRDHVDLPEQVRPQAHERQPGRARRRRRTRRSARSRATRALLTSSTSARRSRSKAPTRASTRSTSTATSAPCRAR